MSTTTIYVPTPVETLEQAKQLPHGTIARVQLEEKDDWTFSALSDLKNPKQPGARFWFAPMSFNAFLDDAIVGGIALIPVEAAEETRGGPIDDDWDFEYPNGPATPPEPPPATRLVARWKAAR